jgi:hypothetical protein
MNLLCSILRLLRRRLRRVLFQRAEGLTMRMPALSRPGCERGSRHLRYEGFTVDVVDLGGTE